MKKLIAVTLTFADKPITFVRKENNKWLSNDMDWAEMGEFHTDEIKYLLETYL